MDYDKQNTTTTTTSSSTLHSSLLRSYGAASSSSSLQQQDSGGGAQVQQQQQLGRMNGANTSTTSAASVAAANPQEALFTLISPSDHLPSSHSHNHHHHSFISPANHHPPSNFYSNINSSQASMEPASFLPSFHQSGLLHRHPHPHHHGQAPHLPHSSSANHSSLQQINPGLQHDPQDYMEQKPDLLFSNHSSSSSSSHAASEAMAGGSSSAIRVSGPSSAQQIRASAMDPARSEAPNADHHPMNHSSSSPSSAPGLTAVITDPIRAKIAAHPVYPRLVVAYLNCNKIGAPPEVATKLDELSKKYNNYQSPPSSNSQQQLGADPDLDQFMETYHSVLQKYHEELTQPFKEAMAFLKKIETQLSALGKANSRLAAGESSNNNRDDNNNNNNNMGGGSSIEEEGPNSCGSDLGLKSNSMSNHNDRDSSINNKSNNKMMMEDHHHHQQQQQQQQQQYWLNIMHHNNNSNSNSMVDQPPHPPPPPGAASQYGGAMDEEDEEDDPEDGEEDNVVGVEEDQMYGSCYGHGGEDTTTTEEDNAKLKRILRRKYSGHIMSLKQEFMKRKKKGKLPKDARQKLLDWWNHHYKWPYPSEGEKTALAEATGLDQKQINNWFINQRKRHWKPSEDMQYVMVESPRCYNNNNNNNSNVVGSSSSQSHHHHLHHHHHHLSSNSNNYNMAVAASTSHGQFMAMDNTAATTIDASSLPLPHHHHLQ